MWIQRIERFKVNKSQIVGNLSQWNLRSKNQNMKKIRAHSPIQKIISMGTRQKTEREKNQLMRRKRPSLARDVINLSHLKD